MYITKVGELLLPDKTSYPEGVIFEFDEAGPMLIYALRGLSEGDSMAARKGKVELALYEAPPVLFILSRIQGLAQWSDSPFSIRLYDDKGRAFDWAEPIPAGRGLGLHVVLVDADTGILKAQRLVSLSTEFSRGLRAAILRQLEDAGFTPAAYHEKVDSIYRRYTTEELLQRAEFRHRAGAGAKTESGEGMGAKTGQEERGSD